MRQSTSAFTVIACLRQVVRIRGGGHCAVCILDELAALVVEHATESRLGGQVVIVFARHFAGTAARAARAIEIKSVSHFSIPPLSYSRFTLGNLDDHRMRRAVALASGVGL